MADAEWVVAYWRIDNNPDTDRPVGYYAGRGGWALGIHEATPMLRSSASRVARQANAEDIGRFVNRVMSHAEVVVLYG